MPAVPDFPTPIALPPLPGLPIDAAYGRCREALAARGPFLMEAPPGTGKSTRVPLWALATLPGRVLLLEPRRVAARMLARHLSELMGSPLGGLVGLAMRQETRMGPATRLLVVTEGVFTRMIREDQALEGVSCVLFDEFHERSLTSDTGLALALESRAVLRPDLSLGVLSATLDLEALRRLLPEAPVIITEHPGCPVRVVHVPDRTPGLFSADDRLRALPAHMARVILRCLAEEAGSVLAFLPGAREIRKVYELLAPRLPAACDCHPLLGRLSSREQERALAPSPAGRRKVVLATDIAETSLTIRGVRVVVDSGLQRRPRYDPAAGASRLVTRPIPLSSARQRAGRAGRLEPGVCVRLWSPEAERGMIGHARPEILESDLTELALDLALWGTDPADMAFVTQPPAQALAAGRALLARLGALDGEGHANTHGRRLARLGAHPREGTALLRGAERGELARAALACALLEETLAGSRDGPADLTLACDRAAKGTDPAFAAQAFERAQRLAAQTARALEADGVRPAGGVPRDRAGWADAARRLGEGNRLALALLPGHADRLAMREEETASPVTEGEREATRAYTCANGLRLRIAATEGLARARFVLVLDTRDAEGSLGRARLTLGCPLPDAAVYQGQAGTVEREREVWADRSGRGGARVRERIGAIVLAERAAPVDDPGIVRRALCELVAREGLRVLPLDRDAGAWLDRARFLARIMGEPWPAMDEAWLLERVAEWLPEVPGGTDLRRLTPQALMAAWRALLPWQCARDMDRLAPPSWRAPSGRAHPIEYGGDSPVARVKLQECFGLTGSPRLPCGARLTLHLLSPSGQVLAVTSDLAFFWREAYPAVRAETRGRYPRHPWPENPLEAMPTALTNRRLAAAARGGGDGKTGR